MTALSRRCCAPCIAASAALSFCLLSARASLTLATCSSASFSSFSAMFLMTAPCVLAIAALASAFSTRPIASCDSCTRSSSLVLRSESTSSACAARLRSSRVWSSAISARPVRRCVCSTSCAYLSFSACTALSRAAFSPSAACTTCFAFSAAPVSATARASSSVSCACTVLRSPRSRDVLRRAARFSSRRSLAASRLETAYASLTCMSRVRARASSSSLLLSSATSAASSAFRSSSSSRRSASSRCSS
mmetsp:Transcript_5198/g.13097  ORF Transcript_5198/g.13097 Transcript_5198/m.13097 type:complete len:248 (-) Transcript_5198:538-1281(-)